MRLKKNVRTISNNAIIEEYKKKLCSDVKAMYNKPFG